MPQSPLFYWPAIVLAIVFDSPLLMSQEESRSNSQLDIGGLSPAESMTTFQAHPDLKVELVASEPLVNDPVAIRFDEQGRLWVAEMPDYPVPQGDPQGRIKCLYDRDGDGVYETGNVFADGLDFVTGLQPWRQGVVATVAGKLIYLEDRDEDGKADHQETWVSGFATLNTQLRANHPQLSLDGRIYIANGLRNGEVFSERHPDQIVSLQGRDLAYDVANGTLSPVVGTGQFGLSFSDWGERFICSNRNPAMQVVFELADVARTPAAPFSRLTHDVAKAGEASAIFPISEFWTTSNLHEGQFTAACGVKFFRGNGLGENFSRQLYACDPTGNLVHREAPTKTGLTYQSKPARSKVEFLAATDTWFRPVNLATGPDGALYVVDMYRAVIEHPDFMPTELKTRKDLKWGKGQGRIYRISRQGDTSVDSSSQAHLAHEKAYGDWIQSLSSDNGWERDTAFRLLFQAGSKVPSDVLEASLGSTCAEARLATFWLLHHCHRVDDSLLNRMLLDRSSDLVAGILRWVRFTGSELRIEKATWAHLLTSTDEQIRAQLCVTLSKNATWDPLKTREFPKSEDELVAYLHGVALEARDPWTRQAVLIAAGSHAPRLLSRIVKDLAQRNAVPPSEIAVWLQSVASMSGSASDSAELEKLIAHSLELSKNHPWINRILLTLLTVTPPGHRPSFASTPNSEIDELWHAWLEAQRRVATNAGAPVQQRLVAVEACGLALASSDPDPFVDLVTSGEPVALRAQAAKELRRVNKLEPWKNVWRAFASSPPAVRQAICASALATQHGRNSMLDSIAEGVVKINELDSGIRAQLGRGNPDQVKRWEELQSTLISKDRQRVYDQYAAQLSVDGDVQQGRSLFKEHCSKCHRVGDLGFAVGPDISDSRVKTHQQLLSDILLPNQSIDADYTTFVLSTVDGGQFSGVLAADTGTSVTLRLSGGEEMTFAKDEIEVLESTGASLMPEGLEASLTPQAMNDLLSFVKNWRYLDRDIPIEKPQEQ